MDIQLRVDNISDFVGSRRAVWRSYSGVGLFTQGLLATNLKLLTKRNIKAMASPGGSSICRSMTSPAITRVYTRSCCEIDTWLTTEGVMALPRRAEDPEKERKHLPDRTEDSIFLPSERGGGCNTRSVSSVRFARLEETELIKKFVISRPA